MSSPGRHLLEVADLVRGVAYKREESRRTPGDGLVPILRANNIQNGELEFDDLVYVPSSRVSAQQLVRPGDIVIAMSSGSPEVVGKAALVSSEWRGGFGAFCAVLRAKPGTVSGWLYHFLQSPLCRAAFESLATGTNINNLSKSTLERVPVPMVSEDQQREVATALDSASKFKIQSGSHLRAADLVIERFRQAVLVAACSGRLTEDWRLRHPKPVTAEGALLKHSETLKSRKSNEQSVDLELPLLPETYFVAPLGDTTILLQYGTSKRCDSKPGVPVLRMGNIQDGELDYSDLKYCALDPEIERLLLQDGDLLFNRTNSPELVGKSAVFRGEIATSFASYLIRARFVDSIVLPDFVNYWLNSAWGRIWARLAKTDGVSQSNINGTKLGLMPLPLPPIDEQKVIVERASHMLSAADVFQKRTRTAHRYIESSSRSVLANAFGGDRLQ